MRPINDAVGFTAGFGRNIILSRLQESQGANRRSAGTHSGSGQTGGDGSHAGLFTHTGGGTGRGCRAGRCAGLGGTQPQYDSMADEKSPQAQKF